MPPAVEIYELSGGQWRRTRRWEGSVCPTWTDRGLGLLSGDGFHLVDRQGHDSRVWSEDFSRWAQGFSGACDGWRFSPDGAWILRAPDWKAQLIDTRRGLEAFSFAWKPEGGPGLWDSAFSGERLRLFTRSGLLVDLQLPTGALTRQEDFGPSVVYGHNLFGFEGASASVMYSATLSPSGDWVVTRPQSGKLLFYRTVSGF
jgi:hypothetical protein